MANPRVRILYAAACVAGLVAFPAQSLGQFYGPKKKKEKEPARQPERDLKEFRDEADRVLAPLAEGGGAGELETAEYWSVVIVAFTGESQRENAVLGLAKVRAEAGLTAAYAERRDKATVIAYGKYASPDEPQAQADLERIRGMRVNGETPFAAALLTPPSPEHLAGSLPDLDLRNAKRQFGKDRALYTLQVAIYGRPDRSAAGPEEVAEYRSAAEKAAVLLRRDGELAFYYHAPERSMVTVGVFGQEDYDPLNRPGIESFPLIDARKLHPLNLLNGQGIRERIPGAQGEGPQVYRMQPSMLVGVPDS